MGKIAKALNSHRRDDVSSETLITVTLSPGAHPGGCNGQDAYSNMLVTHTLKAEHDASADGTGRGVPIIAQTISAEMYRSGGAVAGKNNAGVRNCIIEPIAQICRTNQGGAEIAPGFEMSEPHQTLEANDRCNAIAFSCKDSGADSGEVAPTLRSMEFNGSHANGGGQVAVAFGLSPDNTGAEEIMPTVTQPSISGGGHPAAVATRMAVRRLTPKECERLQGFPDNWTLIKYNRKPAKDGPRYRAIGNSMATTVMNWLGRRIQMVDEIANGQSSRKAAKWGVSDE